MLCLVGPGDSGKSTILEAIDLALTSRWNVQFDDTDFYNAVSLEPFVIQVTVGELPNELLRDDKFGLEVRGWNKQSGIRDEPTDDDESVLTIQLKVDRSLEPTWTVVNDRNLDGRVISAKDREKLKVVRLGPFLNRQFSWSRGSILARLTGDLDQLNEILAQASRAARNASDPAKLTQLQEVSDQAQEIAKSFGISAVSTYQARLDAEAVSIGAGAFALHDGEIPIRQAGLGTRRLLAFALQHRVFAQGGVVLVDELEHGLEPHRIRRLITKLRPAVQGNGEQEVKGQVFITTHSPVVVCEIPSSEIQIVRLREGNVTVSCADEQLQAVVRAAPEALLGRKIIVCEGKTEVGVCRAFDMWWADQGQGSFAYEGVVPVDGGGETAPNRATKLARMGYQVAFLGDSDKPLNPSREQMSQDRIQVVLWDDDCSIEERIFSDVPWDGVLEILEYAQREKGEVPVRDAVATALQTKSTEIKWEESTALRKAIGKAAKKAGWFKKIGAGEELGQVVTRYVEKMQGTDFARKMQAIREWVDDNRAS